MATSSTQAEVYAATQDTTEETVTQLILTQTEQIARYFTDDLSRLADLANLNLIKELEIPSDPRGFSLSRKDIINMLYEDLTHMLRERLITAIHLLLSEPQSDPNTGAYPLRYHAMYTIQQQEQGDHRLLGQPRLFGGRITPPERVWVGARFALLIDWDLSANERRRQVRRPLYCFDWVPERTHFDARSLIRYRDGGLTYDGVTLVARTEARSPGYSSNA